MTVVERRRFLIAVRETPNPLLSVLFGDMSNRNRFSANEFCARGENSATLFLSEERARESHTFRALIRAAPLSNYPSNISMTR